MTCTRHAHGWALRLPIAGLLAGIAGGCVGPSPVAALPADHPANPDAPTAPTTVPSQTLAVVEPVPAADVSPSPNAAGGHGGMDHGGMDHGGMDHGAAQED